MAFSYSSGTSAVALENETPAQTFFRILTHDDRGSFYCVARRDHSGSWYESFARAAQIANYSIFDTTSDWYLTRNGFGMRSRKSERLRQINALMFDLDCHSGNARYSVGQGIRLLDQAVQDSLLPQPTMLVDTGRGLHVYYVLERSTSYRVSGGSFNNQGLKFFRDVESKLTAVMNAVFAGSGLELDTAVFDFSRVSRIPGTFNTAAGCASKLLFAEERYYTLPSLTAFGALAPKVKASASKKPGAHMINFDKLSLSRVGKIFQLQKLRGAACNGCRELMAFCLYNAAVQVFSDKEDARQKLIEFNKGFSEPLPQADLEQIIRSVSKVGFYRMSAETIVAKLKMTSQEIEQTHFFESRRKTEREMAKRKTAEKRAARNAKILALYAQPGATMQSVAEAVGVCKRTVASVLKACAETVAKKPTQDLREAARAALSSFLPKECNFLADDFKCCGVFRSSGVPACGFGDSPSVFLDVGA